MSDHLVSDNDKRIMKEINGYAEIGDTDGLYLSIELDPYILQKFEQVPFIRTPAHAAAAQGQTTFAIEVLGLLPSLGRKLDTRGLSPLHVALESREKETVMSLVKFDRSLVRVRGGGGFTPLHYAARFYPDLDVLSGFLIECQGSIDDLTNRFQSAVHLVVESKEDEAIDLVLKWLIRTTREPVLERKDDELNTALHLAARHGCEKALRLMVSIAKLNKRNSNDKTPLDVAMDSGNERMVKILKSARAKRAQHLTPKESSAKYLCSGLNILETAVRSYCIMLKDLTIEMRSIVLIVAVLITTATYQAILQPPGGIFSGSEPEESESISPALDSLKSSRVGKMVMGESDYNQFMPANTLAFTLSMVTIIFVLHGRPYNVILHVCLVFVAYSYLIAMESISDNESVARVMFVLSWGALSAAFGLKMSYYGVKALFEDVWWLPRCGVMWHNVAYGANGRTVCIRGMAFARKLRRQSKLMQRLELGHLKV